MKGIYSITCTIHNRQYIGSAINLLNRQRGHFYALKHNRHGNQKLQRAYNKYGISAFIFDILEEIEDANNLIPREQFYIDTLNPFYNICRFAGSNLGRKNTPEARKKISLWATGRKMSIETRQKMSLARKGKPMSDEARSKLSKSKLGTKHSKETREKISALKIGVKHTAKAKANMSAARKGIPKTPEHNAKNAAAHIGMRPSPETLAKLRGRKLTPEHCAKISELKKKLFSDKKIKRNKNGTFLKRIP